MDRDAVAVVGGWVATDLREVTEDLSALDGRGWWAVLLPAEGPPLCARFAHRAPAALPTGAAWRGPPTAGWRSSMGQAGHRVRVAAIRAAIARGEVYQVNLTRRLSAPAPRGADVVDLAGALARLHPAPHAATLRIPSRGVHVASASPELFLRRRGRTVTSRPIKGTAADPTRFLPKDRAENVMIVDLVRNDLGMVCEPGSVRVPGLCEVEAHPGLVHLVSTVQGELRGGVGWEQLLAATFPPASVTGAPKLAALAQIARLETVPRGPYCGALGWVDADAGTGELNVAIRTFWLSQGALHLGTGGAITWDSEASGEWHETELKARALLAVATGPQGAQGTHQMSPLPSPTVR